MTTTLKTGKWFTKTVSGKVWIADVELVEHVTG